LQYNYETEAGDRCTGKMPFNFVMVP